MNDLISRQQAIDALAKIVPYAIFDESTESYTNGLTDAYNLICQLPSAQPVATDTNVGDTISRKGVFIPNITVEMFRNASLEGVEDLMASGEMEDISLPSAQPERMNGKWTPHREKSCEYIGATLVYVTYDYWFCDTCGYRVEDGQPLYNFCPNCGADMRG